MILSKCAENGVDSFAAATEVLGYAGSRRRTESNVGSCDFGCLRLRVPSRHNSLPTSLRSLTENVNACWSQCYELDHFGADIDIGRGKLEIITGPGWSLRTGFQ